MPETKESAGKVATRALIVTGIVSGAIVIWWLNDLLLLVFGAVLVAVILRAAADGLRRFLPIGMGLAIALAFILILGGVAGILFLFGAEVSSQASQLIRQLPAGFNGLRDLVGAERFDQAIQEFSPSGSNVLGFVQQFFGILTSVLAGLVLAILGGVYLAVDPGTYRGGFTRLFPHRARPAVDDALGATGRTLRYWLLGQLAAMLGVGIFAFIGLVLIGVPSPLALAVLATLLDFVPLAGPILAAIPGILIALTVNVETALLAALVYLVVQQIEGNVFQPIFMKKAVDLPPALTLFGLFLTGGLFGPVGVVLGGPLIVTAFVLVRKLWVERALEDPIKDEAGGG